MTSKELNQKRQAEYRARNREKLRATGKAWRAANLERARQLALNWYYRNRETTKIYARERNRRCRGERNAYRKRRWKTDLEYRLLELQRNRLFQAIAGHVKSARTTELLGCTVPELRAHLESLFVPGMTWENYGQWHVDHKRPCASFNLGDASQQRECFHYTNLQPLWALDNMRKGARC